MGTSLINLVDSVIREQGRLPSEPPLSRVSLPEDISLPEAGLQVPHHLLPAVLKPADKRFPDLLSNWPLTTPDDLGGLPDLSQSGVSKLTTCLGRLGLLSTDHLKGRHLSLSHRGLALLARRDRASVATAVRRSSIESGGQEATLSWRSVPGTRSRPLARTIHHTEGAHRFMALLSRQARSIRGYRVLRLTPSHHTARYFRHGTRLRSIHPEGSSVVQAGGRTWPFFLEWERQALHPSIMAARLAP